DGIRDATVTGVQTCALPISFAVWLVAAASASAFTAQGSAKQVYVTGLAPNAQVSLLSSKGATVYTQNADSLGGLLFRNVAPGTEIGRASCRERGWLAGRAVG